MFKHVQESAATQGWALHPLYAILHETIYCQGQASLWAAQSVREVRCPRLHACHASLAAQQACWHLCKTLIACPNHTANAGCAS